jgi:hypothetical protein
MNATDQYEWTSAPPRPRWRKRLLWSALSLLVVFVVGTYLRFKWVEYAARKELEAIVAELDASDPGWRLEQIEAARKVIPDEENAALVVMQIVAKIPKPPPRVIHPGHEPKSWDERVNESSPEEELEPDIYWELRKELNNIQPLLKQTRGLAQMKDGRFPITYASNGIGTLLKCQDAREVVYLLRKDALVLARERDVDGALESAHATLVAGRSIGDEPLLVSQLVRMGCAQSAAGLLERILAQGQPSEQALNRLQRLLLDEESTPFLIIALRGERGTSDLAMKAFEDGALTASQFSSGGGKSSNLVARAWEALWTQSEARKGHPVVLRMLTESIDNARLPLEQRAEAFKAQEERAKSPDTTTFVRLLLPATYKIAEVDLRVRAVLRSAIVAIAAERFRLAYGRWPKDLAELVPEFLKQVPFDPYDGQPLRMRAVADGLAIYSIGPDRVDNGGAMNRRAPNAPGNDLVFRLWNVDARRKPALNPDVGPPRPTPEDLLEMTLPKEGPWVDPAQEKPKAGRPQP